MSEHAKWGALSDVRALALDDLRSGMLPAEVADKYELNRNTVRSWSSKFADKAPDIPLIKAKFHKWIARYKKTTFTVSEVTEALRGSFGTNDIHAALADLVESGFLSYEIVKNANGGGRPTHTYTVTEKPEQLRGDSPIAPDPDLDSLIDRILRRQERRTLRSVTQSRAMQAVIARLSTALDGDESALRAAVEEVLDTLGHAVTWNE